MIKRLKGFLRRFRGVSTPLGGVSWAPPEPDPSEHMLEQYLAKWDIPDVALRMPLIIQVGGATLSSNENLLSLCRNIELHGKPHPFSSWFRQGLLEHECLAFVKWQIETKQGVRALLTVREQQQVIDLFKRSSVGQKDRNK